MTNFPPNLATKFYQGSLDAHIHTQQACIHCTKSIKTFMFLISQTRAQHTNDPGYAYGQFAGYQQAGYMGYVYNEFRPTNCLFCFCE